MQNEDSPLLLDEDVVDSLNEETLLRVKDVKLRQYNRLLQAKKKWILGHRIFFYQPICATCFRQKHKTCQDPLAHANPIDSPQWGFLHSPAHTKLAVGTNRSGKSTTGIVDDVADALGFRPWELPEELVAKGLEYIWANLHLVPNAAKTRIRIPARILIVAEDWDKADEIFVRGTPERAGLLTRYIPEDALEGTRQHHSGVPCEFRFKNGSSICIETEKSFINNPKSAEGGQYDKIHYDEPKKRALRDAYARGLADTHGFESFTLTPLAEPWIKNEIYDKAGIDPEVENFFFHAEDNPHISQDGWKNFVSKLDDLQKEARAEGKWTHLHGLVYPQFSSAHVKDGGNVCDEIPPKWAQENASLYVAIDPHPKKPMTAIFMLADSKGRLTVCDEVYKEALIPEFCELINLKAAEWGMTPITYLIDPLAFENDPRDGLCWADDFISAGIFVEPAPKRKSAGILAVRKQLKEEITTDGKSRIVRNMAISKNCKRTIFEFQNYMFREPTQKYGIDTEKPVDKEDHAVECIYRLVLINPQFIDLKVKVKPLPNAEVCP